MEKEEPYKCARVTCGAWYFDGRSRTAARQPFSGPLGLESCKGAFGKREEFLSGPSESMQEECYASDWVCLVPWLVTRLNVADDPTRSCRIREASALSFRAKLSQKQIQLLHSAQLARWISNWLRLIILPLCFSQPAAIQSASSTSQEGSSISPWIFGFSSLGQICRDSFSALWTSGFWIFLFLAPLVLCAVVCWIGSSCPRVAKAPYGLLWILLLFWILLLGASLVDAMEPRTELEMGRATKRAGVNLIATRVAWTGARSCLMTPGAG